MVSVENLVIALGKTVASKLFADYLAKYVHNPIKRLRAAGARDQVTGQLVTALEPFIASEYPEETRHFLLEETRRSIESLPLTAAYLASHNYNTDTILVDHLAAHPPNPDLERLGLGPVFDSLLRQVTEFCITLAPILPDWETANWQQHFAKLDAIQRQLESQTNVLRDLLSVPQNELSTIGLRYLTQLASEYAWIQFSSVGTAGNIPPLSLALAYVQPLFKILSPPERQRRRTAILPFTTASGIADVHHLLATKSDIVIIALPGYGKTTFLRYLTWRVSVSQQEHPSSTQEPERVPFLFLVRDFKDFKNLPSPQDFLACCAPMFASDEARRFSLRAFKEGNALVLIDGLDECEVPPLELMHEERYGENRTEWDYLISWIMKLKSAFGQKNQFVITSRPSGYNIGRLRSIFSEVRLLPLNRRQQKDFVFQWYRSVELAVSGQASDTAADKASLAAADLVNRIRRSGFMISVAQSPLMLSVLCLVHRFTGKRLPESRTDLLEECLNVLLYNWRAYQGMKPSLIGDLDATQLRLLLQPIAYEMVLRKAPRITEEEILELLRSNLPLIGQNSNRAGQVLSTIRDRSGVLMESPAHEYAFLHLIFRDYLAADEIRQRDQYDILLDHANDLDWQEVIPLAVGGSEGSQEILIRALLHKSPILAGRAIASVRRIDPNLRGEVIERLEREISTDPGRPELLQCMIELGGPDIAALCARVLLSMPAADEAMCGAIVDSYADRFFDVDPDRIDEEPERVYRMVGESISQLCCEAVELGWEEDKMDGVTSMYFGQPEFLQISQIWSSGSALLFDSPSADSGAVAMQCILSGLVLGNLGSDGWSEYAEAANEIDAERKIMFMAFLSESTLPAQLDMVVGNLGPLPCSTYPCAQLGILNTIIARYFELLSVKNQEYVVVRWRQTVSEVKNHCRRFLSKALRSLRGSIEYSPEDLRAFDKVFVEEFEAGIQSRVDAMGIPHILLREIEEGVAEIEESLES